MFISKFVSAKIVELVRTMTVNGRGTYDPRTATDVAPYGVDSCPEDDAQMIYADTEAQDQQITLGVVNEDAKATKGQTRLYCAGSAYVLLKTSTIELAGTADNAVRYTALNTALQAEATGINANLTAISAAINAIVPGSYTPTPVTINITAAKINEIKTT
jgi:hypothetical protein